LDLNKWELMMGFDEWKIHLLNQLSEKQIESIRTRTRVGRVLATDNFIIRSETKLGRRLPALPMGRPMKIKK